MKIVEMLVKLLSVPDEIEELKTHLFHYISEREVDRLALRTEESAIAKTARVIYMHKLSGELYQRQMAKGGNQHATPTSDDEIREYIREAFSIATVIEGEAKRLGDAERHNRRNMREQTFNIEQNFKDPKWNA